MRPAPVLLALLLGAAGCGVPRPVDPDGRQCDGGTVHRCGISEPDAGVAFHGSLVRDTGWDLRSCAKCHGADLRGGQAQVSCLGCHEQGVNACETCHGKALASGAHPGKPLGAPLGRRLDCAACHPAPAAPKDPLEFPRGWHLNGRVDVADAPTGCAACHGDERAFPGAGAHEAHLRGSHRLSGPVACSACHQVPAELKSAGHLDSDLPAEVNLTSGLGAADGARPAWDGARCSNSYCHGGGAKLGRDQSPGLLRAPEWRKAGQAACGTCHGVPPRDADHDPAMRLIDCARCHPQTMDGTGAILVSGDSSAHINGVVDAK